MRGGNSELAETARLVDGAFYVLAKVVRRARAGLGWPVLSVFRRSNQQGNGCFFFLLEVSLGLACDVTVPSVCKISFIVYDRKLVCISLLFCPDGPGWFLF